MAIFSKTKRVTEPLDDEAKARIFSNHSSTLHQDDSPELEFLDDGPEDEVQTFYDSDSDLSENSPRERSGEASEKILKMALNFSDYDPYRNTLLAHVSKAAEAYSGFRSQRKHLFKDKVASFLRELGHDAAVCVTKWNSSPKLTAGSYDFIDVVYNHPAGGDDHHRTASVRYFVDLDFASEFEIARPTSQYALGVLQLLPRVFVGKEENLRTVVRESCDAAKRSLKSRGLSLPPWRRFSYLQRKWFGPCTRRVVGSSFEVAPLNKDAVSCRSVGFDDAVTARLFIRT
ncbi:hypothetical protein Rs2_24345 [Raphanus sativus]|uniref:Uncharacterized protein LOC108863275 n=1 Tax=Raphanus sativus TaxID=3726 RepID=A0A6J0P834_RAPSA|nr:uncharacterized protein LOC108863275 [Raphanus sativus]KAJ4897551.1 hypothetical protein Rs2_24345 [Raphanus sativus]